MTDATDGRRVSAEMAAVLRLLLTVAADELSPRDVALVAAEIVLGRSPNRGHWQRMAGKPERGKRTE